MTAARQVPAPVPDDFAVVEGDDISMFSTEGQAIIRAAEARIALGIPSPTVPGAEILARVERQRAEHADAAE
jgi:hypothetical protein